jgi:HlyD family secretion protein
VAQKQAAEAQARVDLGRTRITSPVTGIVVKRSVERGQTVASSLQSPELFVIAKNLEDMQVEAAIDESDVGRLKPGQKASFTVDAFPGETFEGTVRQVRLAALNVANVVTYVAVIGFGNGDGRLLPGMTANVRVITDSRSDVLRVPNAALRVRLPGVEAAAAPAAPASGAGANARNASRGRVYVLDGQGKPRAVALLLGVSDGNLTEVLPGADGTTPPELAVGATVVVGVRGAAAQTRPNAPRAPF